LTITRTRIGCLLGTTLLAACGAGGAPAPSLGVATLGDSPTVAGSVVTVYGGIAQNALVCWFGASGPLRPTHIFHADLPSAATSADIIIHERDATQANPRGARAFLITLTRDGGGESSRVAIENKKFPADLGDAMRSDVLSWVRGGNACQTQVVRPPPPPVESPPVKKAKRKR
jgi:hypothetical protein